jgi:hypothetical protein
VSLHSLENVQAAFAGRLNCARLLDAICCLIVGAVHPSGAVGGTAVARQLRRLACSPQALPVPVPTLPFGVTPYCANKRDSLQHRARSAAPQVGSTLLGAHFVVEAELRARRDRMLRKDEDVLPASAPATCTAIRAGARSIPRRQRVGLLRSVAAPALCAPPGDRDDARVAVRVAGVVHQPRHPALNSIEAYPRKYSPVLTHSARSDPRELTRGR